MENNNAGIVELIDRALNKGVILNADLVITVADIPLLAANLRLALASVETMLKYGVMNDLLMPTLLKEVEKKTPLEKVLIHKELEKTYEFPKLLEITHKENHTEY